MSLKGCKKIIASLDANISTEHFHAETRPLAHTVQRAAISCVTLLRQPITIKNPQINL